MPHGVACTLPHPQRTKRGPKMTQELRDAGGDSAAQLSEREREEELEAAVARGELRRVRKLRSRNCKTHARAPAAEDDASSPSLDLVTAGETSHSDDDSVCEEFEYVTVTPEERMRLETESRASAHWARGNDLLKRNDFKAAEREYTSSLRYVPSAVVFANRSHARLKLGDVKGSLADADLAVLLMPTYGKAFVRMARAQQSLGDFAGAEVSARRALGLNPKNLELKRLVRELQAAEAEASYEAALLAAAGTDEVVARAAISRLGLPEAASRDIREVAETAAVAAAVVGGAAEKGAELRTRLPVLRRALRSALVNRDAFSAAGGVAALVGCFAEDNQLVLSTLLDCTEGCERGAIALARAPGAVELLVRCVRDRRIAIITLALDLLKVLVPMSAEAAASASAEPVPEILLRMLGTAPPALAERAVALLRALQRQTRLVEELRPLAQLLAEGASRVFSGDGAQLFPPGARLSALECALEASRRDPAPHGAALRSCKRTLPSLLSALRVSAATAPERRRREFAGGAELIFRDFSRMTDEAQGAAVAALKLVAALASADGREEAPAAGGPKKGSDTSALAFALAFDASADGWTLLVPMLDSPRGPLAAPAVLAAKACVAKVPGASAALLELGATDSLLDLTDKGSAEVAEAAAFLLAASSRWPSFHTELRKLGQGGLPRLCDLLLRTGAPANVEDAAVLEYMTAGRPSTPEEVVGLWYRMERDRDARVRVEDLMVLLMDTEAGAKALAAAAAGEEGKVLALVKDLRYRRAVDAAIVTGGASMLNPQSVGLETPFSAVLGAGLVGTDRAREDALSRIDASALASYLATILPAYSGLGDRQPVVVDVCAGTGGLAVPLALELAPGGAMVYAAERQRHLADFIGRRAAATQALNVVPVFCADALDALPVAADILVFAAAWTELLTDDESAMSRALGKLRPDGKAVIIEDDPKTLGKAKALAQKAGLEVFSEPSVFPDRYLVIMERRDRK